MDRFILHPRLVAATTPIGDLALSRLLLLDDHRYPWLLLVPRRLGVEEIYQLEPEDRARLIEEIALASEVLRDLFAPDRINIADIGNRAPQLHVHIVGRSQEDDAWPAVVWSRPREPWPEADGRQARRDQVLQAFRARTEIEAIAAHEDPPVEPSDG